MNKIKALNIAMSNPNYISKDKIREDNKRLIKKLERKNNEK